MKRMMTEHYIREAHSATVTAWLHLDRARWEGRRSLQGSSPELEKLADQAEELMEELMHAARKLLLKMR